jgi:hypothetical protein
LELSLKSIIFEGIKKILTGIRKLKIISYILSQWKTRNQQQMKIQIVFEYIDTEKHTAE